MANNKSKASQSKYRNNVKQSSSSQKVETRQVSNKTNTHTNTKTNTETKQIVSASPRAASTTPNKENTNQHSEQSQAKKPSGKMSETSKKVLGGFILIGGSILVGLIAALLGGRMRDGLTKPPAYPPDWLFPVMWSILYIAIGVAAYLAYFTAKDPRKRTGDMIAYGVHLFFNMFWTLFYFRLDLLIFSTIWLGFMIITAIVVTYRFIKANLASGIIFIIYTLWLLYAMYLSLGITILNLV